MTKIIHTVYHDVGIGALNIAEHFECFGGAKLIYRINTRSHGDDSDIFVDVAASIRRYYLFADSHFSGSLGVRVVNQKSRGDNTKLIGYFLCIDGLMATTNHHLTASPTLYVFLKGETEDIDKYLLEPTKHFMIAGFFEPVEEGFV